MTFLKDLINLAKNMDSKLILGMTPEHKFYVIVDNVWLKQGPLKKPVQGLGITINDAAEDYYRQIRGFNLVNLITDKENSFV